MSMEIGEKIWQIIDNWDYLSKDTIGKQLIKSVDSIAANLSEGYGRYHYKETKHFYYYSRGSLYETKTWLIKAFNRKLISEKDFNLLLKEIYILSIKLNNYINTIGKTSNNKTM